MIGQRLRLARTASGLTLRDLAVKMDRRVTAQAISLYERNASMPSSGVLLALAEALDVPVAYLAGRRQIDLKFVRFRTKGPTNKRLRAQLEAQVIHMLERYLTIEEVLGLPSIDWVKPSTAPYPVAGRFEEADHAAENLRRHWGLGDGPIANLAELLEDRGVKVLATDLTAEVHGLMAEVHRPQDEPIPVIVVRRMQWGDRQRFTMAHELGHLLMAVNRRLDVEKAAHRFAGAFLMPQDAMRAALGTHRTSICLRELFDLKPVFGVSVQALTHRCLQLGIIGRKLFRRLTDEFTARGWSVTPFREPLLVPSEEPTRFERLCLRALAEGAISDSKGAELLNVGIRDLDDLMYEPPSGMTDPGPNITRS